MIAGFCWPQSACHRGQIELFCHTTAKTFNIAIVRQGAQDKTVSTLRALAGATQDLEGDIAAQGCQWTAATALNIEPQWPPGFYLVKLEDSDGGRAEAFFVVRAAEPAEATLVLSTSTWNAYNTWGGYSYYTGGHLTSPMRPLEPGFASCSKAMARRCSTYVSATKTMTAWKNS